MDAGVVGDSRVQGILANRALKGEEQLRLSWSPCVFGVPRMALFCGRWMQVICVTLMYIGVKSEVVLLQPGSTFAHGDPCCLHIGPLPSSILIQLPPEAHSVILKVEVIHPPETL